MQVKKFEATTMQEALESIKRELGPEAVILQTRNMKKGFGLLSKATIEVTAAVSDRSMTKKTRVESRLPANSRDALNQLPAEKQAGLYDKYTNRHLQRAESTQERVQIRTKGDQQAASKKITATRYIDIEDDKAQTRLAAPGGSYSSTPAAIPASVLQSSNNQSTAELEQEVQELKQMLQDLKKNQAEPRDMGSSEREGDAEKRHNVPHISLDIPALQDVFEQLVVNGVDRRYALALIKKAAFELGNERSKQIDQVVDVVASELMETIQVVSPLDKIQADRNAGKSRGPAVISFIGPTGVGKTTTLAKIASEAQTKRQLKVGLINLDYYKITAFDQLATYGKILQVPFRSVASVEDLKIALQDFKNLDLVLVDTTGRSHRDPQSLKEIQELLGAVPESNTFLILSATTRDSELFDAASKFAAFKPKGLILSKLDEVIVYGGIYNLFQKVKLPLLYFTTGQKVPDDIEGATRERLVSLLLGL